MSEKDDNVIRVDFGGPRSQPEPDEIEAEGPGPSGIVSGTGEEKHRIFADLLEEGTVMLTLDARRDGVVLPDQFADQFRLNLNFDHLFGIPDFDYDDDGVRASLSFGGVDRWCDIPWSAVYMMRGVESPDVVLFPGQLPAEMMALIPEIERAIEAHQRGEHDEPAEPNSGEQDSGDEDSGEQGSGEQGAGEPGSES